MTKASAIALVSGALCVGAMNPALADTPQAITIAYFTEWPLPMMAYKDSGEYDAALGVEVKWVSYETGTAMSDALVSGDAQFAISQGAPPFVIAVSQGMPLQALDVAVSYRDNANCVVRAELEIDKSNAAELAGRKVAVPLGTAAHYGFLRQMDHFGVPVSGLEIVNMSPPEGAAALSQGAVDFACGYGGGLSRMMEFGNVLLTGDEKEALGIRVYDVTSAAAEFVEDNPDLVAAFLAVTAQANTSWSTGAGGDEMLADIAANAGMDQEQARAAIDTMVFPDIATQLSEAWFGQETAELMKSVATVFVAAGVIDATLDDYADTINTEPLKAARHR